MSNSSVYDRYKNRKENKSNTSSQEFNSTSSVLDRYNQKKAYLEMANITRKLDELSYSTDNVYNSYKTRFFDKDGNLITSYRGDTGDALTKFETSKTDLDRQTQEILDGLTKYEKYLDADTVKATREYLTGYSNNLNGMYNTYKADNDYYSQWENEDAFNRDYDHYTYSNKYAKSTYADLQKAKADIEKQLSENEDDILNRELYWLQNHDTDARFVDTMTDADLENYKKQIATKRKELEAEKTRLQNKANKIKQSAGRSDASSWNGYSECVTRIYQIDDEIKNLDSNVLYYDDAGAVTVDTILNMRAAEEKFGIQGVPVEDLAEDFKLIDRARLWLAGQQGDATSTELNYEYSHPQAKIDMDYLYEKYGIEGTKSGPGVDYSELRLPHDVFEDVDELEALIKFKVDRANYAEQQLKHAEFATKHPVLATGKAILSAPLTALEFGVNVIGDGSDFSKPEYGTHNLVNVYDDYFTNRNETYTGTISQNIDDYVMDETDSEVLAWLASNAYSGGVSAAQSAITTAACTAMFGQAGGTVALAIMGTEAAASTYNNAIMNGSTNSEAILTSVAAGVAEALFEKVSLDGLIKIGKFYDTSSMAALIKSILKGSKAVAVQGVTEASEEFFTEIANYMADEIINGDHSAYQTAINKYKKMGYSDADANELAAKDKLNEIFSALYGGFIGGMGSGAGASAFQGTGATGKVIRNSILANRHYNQMGQNIVANNEVQGLVNSANEIPALKKLADKVAGVKTEELTPGKDTKKYGKQVGKLYKGVQEAQLKNISKTTESAFKNVIKAELEASGVKNVDKVADVLTKAMYGGGLTQAESKIFESVDGTSILNKALNSTEFSEKLSTEQKAQLEGNLKQYVDTHNLTEVKGDVIVDATDEKVDSMIVASLDGKDITLEVKTGDTHQTVTAGELKLSEGYEIVFEGLMDIKDEYGLDETTATKMLTLWEGYRGSAKAFIDAVRHSFMYGQYNMRFDFDKNEIVKLLPENMRNQVFEMGREYKQKVTDEKDAQVKNEATTKATGKVTYAKGLSYKDLNESQKTQVELASFLAEVCGFDLEIFRSPKDASGNSLGINGSYNVDTSLMRLDVDAGTLNGVSLLTFTQGHELTHFIKAWSPAKYKIFADFLVENYGEKGVSVDDLVQKQMIKSIIAAKNDTTGKHHELSYDEAFDEVVCNSCEDFLADPNLRQRLLEIENIDKGLAKKIKDFLRNIVAKLEKFLEGLKGQSLEAKHVRGFDVEALEELKNKWVDALGDSRKNLLQARKNDVKAQKNTTDEGDVKSSKVLSESEVETLDDMGIGFDEQSNTVYSIRYSPKTEEEAINLAKLIAKGTGRSFADAYKWVQAEMSIARTIMDNSEYLDYEADDRYKPIKTNSDYPQGTVDLSNLCPKRIEFTEMFDRLQEAFPNKIITAMDIANMRQILKDNDITVACGICFVDDRRQLIGEISDTFIGMWKDAVNTKKPLEKTNSKGVKVQVKVTEDMAKEYGLEKGSVIYAEDTYVPNQYDLTTYKGFKLLSKNHPTIAMAFQLYNNSRGQQAARLIEGRAEYDRQILKWSDDKVEKVNNEGGLRIFSFSDFEIVHLIDLVQVIMDCSVRGVKIQGYTKRPEFARLVRNTGVKLNRSLIPRGKTGIKIVNGKEVLDFDNVEGIDTKSVDFLDERDNNNVGNILVGINDKQIRLAMLDDFIDYIIPFHTNKRGDVNDRLGLNGWDNYKEFQHDKNASTGKAAKHNINIYTQVIDKYNPKNKVEFVNAFLAECKEQNIIPRYEQFLDKDANGNYVYTEGYHKFLVDFKLFDKEGNILPQENVTPNFDEEFMQELLKGEITEKSNYKFPDKVYKQIVETFGESNGIHLQDRVTSEQDAEYLELAKDPVKNRYQLSEMVKDAAYASGLRYTGLHGTEAFGFTEFKRSKSYKNGAHYFTNKFRTAETYSGVKGITDISSNEKKGNYLVGLDMKNPLVVDCKGSLWNDIPFNIGKKGSGENGKVQTVDVVEYAEKNGYDGVVFKNVIDAGQNLSYGDELDILNTDEGKKKWASDVFAVFNSNQIKSLDPVTYDNKGNVIPLSERFNKGNDDIRYQDRDSTGRELTPEQVEFFKDSKVRDAEGNLRVMYHGTPNGEFNTFRISEGAHSSLMAQYGAGYYFDSNKDSAKRYTNNINKTSGKRNPKVFEVYLNIKNPLEINDEYMGENKERVISKEQFFEVVNRGNYEWFFENGMPFELQNYLGKSKSEIQQMPRVDIIGKWVDMVYDRAYFESEVLSAMVKAYRGDSILSVMKDVFGKDGVKVTDKYGEMWVSWDNTQIKNTDNLNPTESEDIRYQDRVTPKEDADYMDAYYDGDEDLMQELVDKAANKLGYKYKAYHHTENGFTVFDLDKARKNMDIQGFFFSADKDAESEYGSVRYDTYLKMNNPYIVDSKEKAQAIPFNLGKENAGVIAREWLQSQGYDSVIRKAEYYGAEADEYIVFDSSQIKSAEPMTFADDEYGEGDIIPLSERFNEGNEDIRYQDRVYNGSLTQERIDDLIHDSGAGSRVDYANMWIASINPSDFIDLTLRYETRAKGRDVFDEEVEGDHGGVMGDRDYIADLKNSRMPYLRVDIDTGKVIGHDGRHRMRALEKTGASRTPIGIIFEKDGSVYKGNYNGERLETIEYMRLTSQFDDRFYSQHKASILDIIPLNEDHRAEIEGKYRAKRFEVKYGLSIAYQDRPVSDREILVDAMSNSEELSIEDKNRLEIYREKIDNINALEQELADVGKQIHSIITTEGSDRKQLNSLNKKADTLRKKISRVDGELLRIEAMKPIQNLVEIRKKQMLKAYKQKVQEQKHKNVEGRNKTAAKNKIKKVVKTLESLYSNPTKEKNVKIEFQEMVRTALAMSDVLFNDHNAKMSVDDILAGEITTRVSESEQKTLDEWRKIQKVKEGHQQRLNALESSGKVNQATHDKLLDEISRCDKKLKALSRKLSDVAERQRAEWNETVVQYAVDSLVKAYESLKNSKEGYAQAAYNEYVATRLNTLKESLANATAKTMTLAQLDELYQAYKMVLTSVRTANELFVKNKRMSVIDAGETVINEVKKVANVTDDKIAKLRGLRKFSWEELKPVYAFERIGSETFMELYKEVLRGQNVLAKDIAEAQAFFDEKAKAYGYKSWDLKERKDFTIADGRVFSIDLEEIMSIYAYSKRDQALDHMTDGGFVFDKSKLFTDTKKKGLAGAIKRERTTVEAYRLNNEVFYKIINSLTEEQKKFVDDMQEYLSAVMGAKGNEVSRVLYGIDLFKEKIYFPLMSSEDFKQSLNSPAGEVELKNAGMTKETIPHAKNPIVLKSFMDVWAGHVNKMSTYHSFVLPIENLNKIFNYTGYAQSDISNSVRTVLEGAYGQAVSDYISTLIKDLNGGVKVQGSGNLATQMISRFKKTAVAASTSVVVQQPTAIVRALAMIDAKYFVHGLDGMKHKDAWEELKKYAPVAIIKEMGGFDMGGGRQVTEYIMRNNYKGKEKVKNAIDDALMWGASVADETGWLTIWSAVKKEIADTTTYKVGSEEFLKACGERFTEVVDYTQVYDSVISRSGFMRNKGEIAKMATSFMGEPTTSFNMLFNAVLQAKRGSIGKGKATRIIGATMSSILLAAVAKSLIYALRDDDEDESYLEKYAQALTNALAEDLFIPNMLPFVSDITSLLGGWDVERTDMAIIKDVVDAFSGLDSDSKSAYRKVEDLAGAIAALFGVPVKNVMRTVREMYNFVANIFDENTPELGDVGDAVAETLTGGNSASDVNKLLEKGKTEKARELINELVADKVKQGKTEKEAKASVKASVTSYWKELYLQAYRDKDNAEMLRIRRILQSTGLYDDVVGTCSNWIKGMKDEKDTKYKKW